MNIFLKICASQYLTEYVTVVDAGANGKATEITYVFCPLSYP